MTAERRGGPEPELVASAQRGNRSALDALIAQSLPLLYTITARALRGGPDVDDVVQDTLLQVVRHLGDLRAPDAYRSWLVAIAVRQIRAAQARQRSSRARHEALDEVPDIGDPLLDVGDEAVLHLRMVGERRELAEAVQWLDDEDRTLLSLWWLEETGHLDRSATVATLGQSGRHVAVRLQRLREHLDTTRTVVRALRGRDRCPELRTLTRSWDGRPSGLWRKRVWRHIRTCPPCRRQGRELLSVQALLLGLPLFVVPVNVVERIVHAVLGHVAGSVPATALTAARYSSPLTPPSHSVPGRVARAGWHLQKTTAAASVGAVAVAVTVGAFTFRPSRPDPPAVTARPAATTPMVTARRSTPVSTPVPASRSSATTASVAERPTRVASVSGKKGVCAWSFSGADAALTDSGATWYYTWAVDHQGIGRRQGFVPMIWGTGSVTTANLATAAKAGPYLLGFNEPDLAAQANMTVQTALDLWPKLEATGRILGSPAVAAGADVAGGWLDRFMSGARNRGYRVDFIALHWYGGDFDGVRASAQLRDYVQRVYARYHKPIWLTEYALIDFSRGTRYPSADQQRTFVVQSTRMLQSLPYLQRYAWFALQHSPTSPTGLYDSGARPTPSGTAFRAAGR